MTFLDILRTQLRVDEGERLFPYKDTVGKITIGVGRNLTDKGISLAESALFLDNDIATAVADAKSLIPNFDDLSEARKAVACNMAFNLGKQRFAGFENTLRAIREGRYEDASQGMLASLWAKQVGERAQRLARAMRG